MLAHPGRYDIGKATLHALFAAFKEAGGTAVEVVSGSHTPEQYRLFADLARQYGFLCSAGSDYHGPAHNYFDMGKLPPLPPDCAPVWGAWPGMACGGDRRASA